MNFLLVLFALVAVEVARADSTSVTVDQFCKTLLTERDQIQGVNRWSLLRDFLKLAIAPGKLVKVNEEWLPTDPSKWVKSQEIFGPREVSSHLIFSIHPPESSYSSLNEEEARISYSRLMAEITTLSESVFAYMESASVQECTDRIKTEEFDPNHFLNLIEQKSQFRWIDEIDLAQSADRAIARMQRHSRLHWQVIQTTNLYEVYLAISGKSEAFPHAEDIVIFSHGMSGGRLLDSSGSAYPIGFFNDISPRLRTLTVFACHGEESESLYSLKNSLSAGVSFHPSRGVFLSVGSHLGGRDELVPMTAFRSFMRRVERKVRRMRAMEDSVEPATRVYVGSKQCAVDLPGLQLSSGTLGVELNGKFLGSLDAQSPPRSFQFPCRFFKIGKNIFVLKSLGLYDHAIPKHLDFKIEAITPGVQTEVESIQHFFRRDGSYQGSRMDLFKPETN